MGAATALVSEGSEGEGCDCGTLKVRIPRDGWWSLRSWPPSLVGERAGTTPTLLHGRVGSRLKWGLRDVQTGPRGSEFQWGEASWRKWYLPWGLRGQVRLWPLEMKVEVMRSPPGPAWGRSIYSWHLTDKESLETRVQLSSPRRETWGSEKAGMSLNSHKEAGTSQASSPSVLPPGPGLVLPLPTPLPTMTPSLDSGSPPTGSLTTYCLHVVSPSI